MRSQVEISGLFSQRHRDHKEERGMPQCVTGMFFPVLSVPQ